MYYLVERYPYMEHTANAVELDESGRYSLGYSLGYTTRHSCLTRTYSLCQFEGKLKDNSLKLNLIVTTTSALVKEAKYLPN